MRFIWRMFLTGGKGGAVSNLGASDNFATATKAPTVRAPFEGVLNVVRFNWPLYVAGAGVAAAGGFGGVLFSPSAGGWAVLFFAAAPAGFLLWVWLVVSF